MICRDVLLRSWKLTFTANFVRANVGIRLFLLHVNKKSISHLILDNFVQDISIDLAALILMHPYFSSISLNMLIRAYNLTKNKIMNINSHMNIKR